MMRRTVVLLCALSLAAGAARAQQTYYLGNSASDSTLGLIPGVAMNVPVQVANNNAYYLGVEYARVTVHYDPAAVTVFGAAPGLEPTVTDSSRGTGTFTFALSGSCVSGSDLPLANLSMQLSASASSGTVVYLTTDSTVTDLYCEGAPAGAAWSGSMTSLCTATTLYGDVDANGRVDSRDALIALSAAVGLPVAGFNLGAGDVDGDGLTNSRDALIILSVSIGLNQGPNRIGFAIPVNCPAASGPGEDVVVRVRTPYFSDSLAMLDPGATTPVVVHGTGYGPQEPRLASDGVSIVYTCGSTTDVCRTRADSGGYAQLTTDSYGGANLRPDWSPSGASVAYGHHGQYLARLDTGITRVLSNNILFYNVYGGGIAWSRDGSRVAYVKNDGTIWLVNADSSGDAQLAVNPAVTDALLLRFSPSGDTLAFTRTNEPGIWIVPTAGGTVTQLTSFNSLGSVSNQELGFDWGPHGIVFASELPGRMGIWVIGSSGALWRVAEGAYLEPSWRRNP